MTTPEDTPLYGKTDGLFAMSLPTYPHFGLLSHLFLRYLFVFHGMVFLWILCMFLDLLAWVFSLTNIARLFGRICSSLHFKDGAH